MANYYDPDKPKYEWGSGWRAGRASEKQAQYITVLIDKLATQGLNIQMVKPLNELTKGEASCLINELRDAAPNWTSYLRKNCSTLVTIEN